MHKGVGASSAVVKGLLWSLMVKKKGSAMNLLDFLDSKPLIWSKDIGCDGEKTRSWKETDFISFLYWPDGP